MSGHTCKPSPIIFAILRYRYTLTRRSVEIVQLHWGVLNYADLWLIVTQRVCSMGQGGNILLFQYKLTSSKCSQFWSQPEPKPSSSVYEVSVAYMVKMTDAPSTPSLSSIATSQCTWMKLETLAPVLWLVVKFWICDHVLLPSSYLLLINTGIW